MPAPLVSVIIPNYNYARYVGQAIESVLAQTFRDFEIIVIDNGSTDDSLEVLKSYEGRIRVIAQENRGQSGSRNRGIAESHGTLLAFLDADDVWLPSKLEKQVSFFSDPSIGLVYCGVEVTDKDLKPKKVITPDKRGYLLDEFVKGVAVVQCGESTAVIRKVCFEQLGDFDTKLSICAGWDMYRRICSRYQVELVPEPLMRYRMHGSNAHGRVDIFEHDVLLRLEKMHSDPLSKAVHPFKRESYGRAYLLLSGSYLHAGKLGQAVKFGALAMAYRPEGLAYIVRLPVRHLRKLLKKS